MSKSVVQTAYGRAAIEAARDAVAQLKASDPMTPVCVLVPDNIAGIVLRRALAQGVNGRFGVAGIDVTTLAKLAERITAADLAPKRPATSAVLAAAWRRELVDNPLGFALIADHPATVQALVRAHRALRDLSADALDAVAASTRVAHDLVNLHRRVIGRLTPGWYDEPELLRVAAARALDLLPVVMYLPQDLSRAERAFVDALPDATVVLGRTGVRRADRAVLTALSLPDGVSDTRVTIPTGTRVISASDSDDEVRAVVRELMITLQTVPAHRVAVLYSAATPYARIIGEQLAAADVVVNGAGVRPVSERAVPRLLTGLLALADSDVGRAELFQALAAAPSRDFDGARIPLSTWERTSRAAGVVRGDDWDVRLGDYAERLREQATHEAESPDPRIWLVDRRRNDADTAEALRAFAIAMRAQLRNAAGMTAWSALSAWAAELLDAMAGSDQVAGLPADEQYAALLARSAIAGLAGLDAIEPTASLGAMRDAIDAELDGSIPRVGRFGDGVLVAPVSAAVGLDLDVVYVVGLSEDLYPGRVRPDGLLSERARAAAQGQLPALRDQIDRRHRQLLAALACAPNAVVSFPRGDLRRSTGRLPSRFVLPTLRELSGDRELAASEWDRADYRGSLTQTPSYAGTLQTAIPATDQEWRVRQSWSAGDLDDRAVRSAVDLLRARAGSSFTRYDGNVGRLDGLPSYADGTRLVSPTALEDYAQCPHGFFVRRLLGVEPVEQPESVVAISPADIGNLIHYSVEQFISANAGSLPTGGAPWTAEQRAELVAVAVAQAEEFRRRGLTGHPRLWEGERARIFAQVEAMITDENGWRAGRSASVVASELPFGMRGADPVRVQVASGEIAMRGSADRVDRAGDGTIWVTDIKTGRADSFAKITREDPTLGGTKLQLPVYAHAARARYGDEHTPVEAQYWFVRRNAGKRVPLPLTDEVEQRYAQALDVLVRSIADGVFPLKAPEGADYAYTQCSYCNPDGIGHVENRERWERKRAEPELRELITLIDPAGAPPKDGDA